uniref:3-phosphoinositide-dependent protein kinase 2-like n=1 Tax=Rhizophora mucronata TaxID=61149 RepID=A0A2P2MHE8_RHIMU
MSSILQAIFLPLLCTACLALHLMLGHYNIWTLFCLCNHCSPVSLPYCHPFPFSSLFPLYVSDPFLY